MNRHSKRGAAGFSMVELLVTIVIAGIAFVAMVPLFVTAQENQSTDRSRNAAINIAQEKIEQVRYLPWSLLSTTVLTSNSTDVGGLFGTSEVRGGKTYTIAYDVVDSTGTTSLTAYRSVLVRVTWSNRGQAKAVMLKTIVYKQYAGPQIVKLTTTPAVDMRDWITGSDTKLVIGATVNAAQGVASTSKVRFSIMDASGALTFNSVDVTAPTSGTTYTYTWLLTKDGTSSGVALPDGFYYISATAYSTVSGTDPGSPGPTSMIPVRLERQEPPPVTGLKAYPADRKVLLTWDLQASGVDHYEVYRGTTSGGENPDSIASVSGNANTFVDTGLTNVTAYYYKVLAVDVNGNTLALVDVTEIMATPSAPTGTAPSSITITTLAGSANSLKLVWSAALPATVEGYVVYRYAYDPVSGAMTTKPMQFVKGKSTTIWSDFGLAWKTTFLYTVKALDASGLESSAATVGSGISTLPGPDGAPWAKYVSPDTPFYSVMVKLMGSRVSNETVTATLLDSDGLPTTTTYSVSSNSMGVAMFERPDKTGLLPYGDYKITSSSSSSKVYVRLNGDPASVVSVYVY